MPVLVNTFALFQYYAPFKNCMSDDVLIKYVKQETREISKKSFQKLDSF